MRGSIKVTRYKHRKFNHTLWKPGFQLYLTSSCKIVLILIGQYYSNCWRNNGKDQCKQKF